MEKIRNGLMLAIFMGMGYLFILKIYDLWIHLSLLACCLLLGGFKLFNLQKEEKKKAYLQLSIGLTLILLLYLGFRFLA